MAAPELPVTTSCGRTAVGAATLSVELVCLALSPPLLLWAGSIWANILGYNDSGALVYTVIALVVASPSLFLLAVAIGLRARDRVTGPAGRRRHGRPRSMLGALTRTEWLVGAGVLAVATAAWLVVPGSPWH